MKEKQQDPKDVKQNAQNPRQAPIPEEQMKNNPGEDAVAKTERSGAGQQQGSGGNPVINS